MTWINTIPLKRNSNSLLRFAIVRGRKILSFVIYFDQLLLGAACAQKPVVFNLFCLFQMLIGDFLPENKKTSEKQFLGLLFKGG